MLRSKIVLLLIFFVYYQGSFAQISFKQMGKKVPVNVCYGSGKVERFYAPSPLTLLKSGSEKTANIVVEYSLFPEDAQAAFQHAVNIWEHIIQSDIPIHITANWRTDESDVLGSAGPTDYYANFENAPRKDHFYSIAAAERIAKKELNGPGIADIVATFNKNQDWHFGTDGSTPDSLYDFVTVVLHEIAHGLGFTGFFRMQGSDGYYYNPFSENDGEFTAFDYLVQDNRDRRLTDSTVFEIYSSELGNAITSGNLFINSPLAIAGGGGYLPKLYSPRTYDIGSSIYHLNLTTYPNNLMAPQIGKAEAIHNPGDLVTGILGDIGWNHTVLNHEKPKDIEETKPLHFKLSVESDFPLDTASVTVIYSESDFQQNTDTIHLQYQKSLDAFTAELTPGANVSKINYYVTVRDSFSREFRMPTEAPVELLDIEIGPDNEKPEIIHSPVPYYILSEDNLMITAEVSDNLGLDTVFVQYSINESISSSFGLTNDTLNMYSGTFNFDTSGLSDGDVITYNITARDMASVQNTNSVPFKSKYSFKIEQIFEPKEQHYNNFDSPSTDFILFDFDIFTDPNFESGALHSPHPYPSPDANNVFWNFSTMLKYPIILKENSTMSFDEVVLVEPGLSGTEYGDEDFWDYVIVEGSKNMGDSWMPLADGYDCRSLPAWATAYNENILDNNSLSVGTESLLNTREINLLENGNFEKGDTILIRFRLHSDPFAHGWGWTIDNLRIQIPVSSDYKNNIRKEIIVFPNPFEDILNISAQTGPDGEIVELSIYNAMGRKIISEEFFPVSGNINRSLNLGDYDNGMYFLLIREKGKIIYSRKVIKYKQ